MNTRYLKSAFALAAIVVAGHAAEGRRHVLHRHDGVRLTALELHQPAVA